MTPNYGKTTFNTQELALLRAEALAFIERHAMTKKGFAEECDVPEGTFGPWLAGNYAGDNEKPAAKVYRFLTARKEQAEMAASVPSAPTWQETMSAKSIMTVLDHCQVFSDMGVIGTGPGCGKTATIAQFAAVRPRVWVTTMKPSTRGVQNALIAMLKAVGDAEAKGTPQALSERVQKRVGPGAIIIIDEAQHLSLQAVDELRSIHDCTGVGLVFSGDESVFELFDGHGKNGYAQFQSRIGMRHRQSRPFPEDAAILARAHGVTDTASIKMLSDIAQKPGALRGVSKTLQNARRYAAINDVALTPSLIREAYAARAAPLAA